MIFKKAQEEVVGFIAVVVLVVVVFLIFISLNLRKPAETIDSTEISQFMQSAFEYTTDCALDYEPNYASLGDLFEACRTNSLCVHGKSACDTLNETLSVMVPTGLRIGENRPRSAYTLNAVYVRTAELDKAPESLLSLGLGECKGNKLGNTKALPSEQGVIRVSLEVC